MYTEHLNTLIDTYLKSQDMSVTDFKLMDLVRACTDGCNDDNVTYSMWRK